MGIEETGWKDEETGRIYTWHLIMKVFIMAFGLIITVIMMNTYIGILGIAYEDATAHASEVFAHFKAGYILRKLLVRRLLTRCHLICTGRRCKDYAEQDNEEDVEGFWVMIPHGEEAVDNMVALLDKMERLTQQQDTDRKDLLEMMEKLKQQQRLGLR